MTEDREEEVFVNALDNRGSTGVDDGPSSHFPHLLVSSVTKCSACDEEGHDSRRQDTTIIPIGDTAGGNGCWEPILQSEPTQSFPSEFIPMRISGENDGMMQTHVSDEVVKKKRPRKSLQLVPRDLQVKYPDDACGKMEFDYFKQIRLHNDGPTATDAASLTESFEGLEFAERNELATEPTRPPFMKDPSLNYGWRCPIGLQEDVVNSPLHMLRMLLPDEVLMTFVTATNGYAGRTLDKKSWTHDLTIEELKSFFAAVLFLGLVQYAHISLGWEETMCGNRWLMSLMPYSRFSVIMQNLQWIDVADYSVNFNANNRAEFDSLDPIWSIRPFLALLSDRAVQLYECPQDLSVAMAEFNGMEKLLRKAQKACETWTTSSKSAGQGAGSGTGSEAGYSMDSSGIRLYSLHCAHTGYMASFSLVPDPPAHMGHSLPTAPIASSQYAATSLYRTQSSSSSYGNHYHSSFSHSQHPSFLASSPSSSSCLPFSVRFSLPPPPRPPGPSDDAVVSTVLSLTANPQLQNINHIVALPASATSIPLATTLLDRGMHVLGLLAPQCRYIPPVASPTSAISANISTAAAAAATTQISTSLNVTTTAAATVIAAAAATTAATTTAGASDNEVSGVVTADDAASSDSTIEGSNSAAPASSGGDVATATVATTAVYSTVTSAAPSSLESSTGAATIHRTQDFDTNNRGVRGRLFLHTTTTDPLQNQTFSASIPTTLNPARFLTTFVPPSSPSIDRSSPLADYPPVARAFNEGIAGGARFLHSLSSHYTTVQPAQLQQRVLIFALYSAVVNAHILYQSKYERSVATAVNDVTPTEVPTGAGTAGVSEGTNSSDAFVAGIRAGYEVGGADVAESSIRSYPLEHFVVQPAAVAVASHITDPAAASVSVLGVPVSSSFASSTPQDGLAGHGISADGVSGSVSGGNSNSNSNSAPEVVGLTPAATATAAPAVPASPHYTLGSFIAALAQELGTPHDLAAERAAKVPRTRSSLGKAEEVRRSSLMRTHTPVHLLIKLDPTTGKQKETRRHCCVCKKRINFVCQQCNIALCVPTQPGQESCWDQWHSA